MYNKRLMEANMELIIITGMSGAGKSQAMKVLEDMNYYCMDNLPPTLLQKFAELFLESKKQISKVAVVVDIRSGEFFEGLFKALDDLEKLGVNYNILYLDARDNELIKRYKELRRPHPLNREGSIIKGIKNERELLYDIKARADYIIDTSSLKIAELKEEIYSIFLDGEKGDSFSILISSFGFKHGTLLDGDLIFDVRFLPNPYYIPELKGKTGREKEVADYVFKWEQTDIFLEKLLDMLEFLIPYYIEEGKSQLIVGIGCTGGQHRSVAIAEKVSQLLKEKGHRTSVSHRDN